MGGLIIDLNSNTPIGAFPAHQIPPTEIVERDLILTFKEEK